MITEARLLAVLSEVESIIRSRYARKLSMVSSRVEIDDVFQLVALKCYRALSQCRAESDDELRHWVLQAARHEVQTAITGHRAAKRSTAREQVAIGVATDDSRDGFQPAVELDPSVACEIREQCDAMLYALNSLPANQAQAVRMLYLDGREYADIADAMGISINACRLLVSRGIKACRELVTA